MSGHRPFNELIGELPPEAQAHIAQKRDEAIERWLREEVANVCDAMKADPSRGIPAEQVFAEIRALHAQRLKDGV